MGRATCAGVSTPFLWGPRWGSGISNPPPLRWPGLFLSHHLGLPPTTAWHRAPNGSQPHVLTAGPRVGGEGPVLQASKQVEGAVSQAEHGLQAWAPAGRQALGARVHAAVDQDAVGRGPDDSLSPPHALQGPLSGTRPSFHQRGAQIFHGWPFEDGVLPGLCLVEDSGGRGAGWGGL